MVKYIAGLLVATTIVFGSMVGMLGMVHTAQEWKVASMPQPKPVVEIKTVEVIKEVEKPGQTKADFDRLKNEGDSRLAQVQADFEILLKRIEKDLADEKKKSKQLTDERDKAVKALAAVPPPEVKKNEIHIFVDIPKSNVAPPMMKSAQQLAPAPPVWKSDAAGFYYVTDIYGGRYFSRDQNQIRHLGTPVLNP